MKRIKDYIVKLSTLQKNEVIVASLATLILLIAAPVYAWFVNINKMETMTKIQEPANLDICAGDGDAVENFELSNIDLENIAASGQPQCYVFGVITGNEKTFYDIQLAYTTNIPFTYTLYRAEEAANTDADKVVYDPLNGSKKIYYKRKGTALTLVDLNADTAKTAHYGRKVAKTDDNFYDLAYDDDLGDDPEIYAVPIYSQVQGLETKDPDHDFYILEINCASEMTPNNFTKWNAAKNNKETDIIYITASRTTT